MPRVRASGNDMVLLMSVNERRTAEAPDQPMAGVAPQAVIRAPRRPEADIDQAPMQRAGRQPQKSTRPPRRETRPNTLTSHANPGHPVVVYMAARRPSCDEAAAERWGLPSRVRREQLPRAL